MAAPGAEGARPMSAPHDRGAKTPARLGRYELLFPLASGGMGEVYVGRLVGAHGFGRLVAVKILIRGLEDGDARAAFFAEGRIAARIAHANVVPTLDLDEQGGTPFIVMELVRGVPLSALSRRLSQRGERLSAALVAWMGAQAAAGLHAAHELRAEDGRPLGLVHRDVSPQNLLLSYDGRVYVTDFGVAKLVHAELPTTQGIVKGRFAYMSPEQASGKPLDRRSDLFALGAVLHESLIGERLFAADSPAGTVFNVLNKAAPEAHRLREDVPLKLSAAIDRCLKKAAEERFASAAELEAALRDVLGERSGWGGDERALAVLLDRSFGEEKAAFAARLAALERTGSPRVDPDPAIGAGRSRRRWRPLLALLLLSLGAGAYWVARRDPGSPRSVAEHPGPSSRPVESIPVEPTPALPIAPPPPAREDATAAPASLPRSTDGGRARSPRRGARSPGSTGDRRRTGDDLLFEKL